MNKKRPWDDLSSPVYLAIDTKERKSWVIVYAWFCVAVLIFCAFATRYHISCILLSIFLAFGIITKRTTAVSERGLENFIDVQLYTSNDIWTWDEIEALTWENNPKVPDTTLLFFTKGARTRKAFFKNEDVPMIKVLAKKQNKNINIYDGNEYRAEARAYNAEQDKYRKRRKKK